MIVNLVAIVLRGKLDMGHNIQGIPRCSGDSDQGCRYRDSHSSYHTTSITQGILGVQGIIQIKGVDTEQSFIIHCKVAPRIPIPSPHHIIYRMSYIGPHNVH